MLRKRLLFALLALVTLLLGVGTAGLWLLNGAFEEFDTKFQDYSRLSDAEKRIRVVTSAINSRYLAPLGYDFPVGGRVQDRKAYDDQAAELKRVLGVLQDAQSGPRIVDAMERLTRDCEQYLRVWEGFFANYPTTQKDRAFTIQEVARLTQKITEQSEVVGLLYSERLSAATQRMRAGSVESTLFVSSLMVLGLVIAGVVYFHLGRAIVDPVVSLAHSIQEIKRGNFELSLPPPVSNNEFSPLIPAFNEMAVELRQRRRETDDRFLQTNLQNRAIFTAIPTPVFVLNEDGSIDQLNPAAEALQLRLGIIGRLPASLTAIFESCVENRRNYLPDDIREASLFRIDDEEHYFLPRIFRFSTEQEDKVWWAVVLMDVTRFRWLDEVKTNLLATVSHEIKTPVTGIRMVLHLLLEGKTGELTKLQENMVASARDDCERLLLTLKKLLDLSKVESGANQLEFAPVNLVESVERIRQLFAPALEEKGCVVRVDVEPGFPTVSGDSVRLDEVIQNLLSNAIKYSPEGCPIHVRLSMLPDRKFVRLTFMDEGVGVAKEYRSRIFERFFRVPGQTSEGVGLGLSIAREIVLAHGGRIGLLDFDEKNVEFHVDLPIAQGDSHD